MPVRSAPGMIAFDRFFLRKNDIPLKGVMKNSMNYLKLKAALLLVLLIFIKPVINSYALTCTGSHCWAGCIK